jgi:beta-lactamase class A
MKKGTRRFLTFMAVLVAVLAIFPLYSRFKVIAAPVPPGVYLGGLALSDVKDRDEIREHLRAAYSQPIGANFAGRLIALRTQEVDFAVEVDHMIAEATQYLDGPAFMDIAVRYAFGFEQQRRDVPVYYTLDTAKLRAWLEAIAPQYNSLPQRARALAPVARYADGRHPVKEVPHGYVGAYRSDWEWVPGSPGHTLDIEASIPTIVAALTSSEMRIAHLVLIETPAPLPSMADLERILDNQTSQFPGFAAMYVHDLTHDDEASVDSDVSFSGMSTLKIGIAAAVMTKIEGGIKPNDPISYEVGQWLDYALGESNNFAANLLLRYLGDGDTYTGARRFTDFMRSLGYESTFMQSGYDDVAAMAQIPTPGNQQTEWNTNPDTHLQSTPREMGRILSEIYYCTEGKGLLIERYADQITPDECMQILFYMSHDEFRELIWGGLPNLNNQWIVHKHGFAFESHSDVALVWGPNGPYVISIFLWRPGWMDWATSNGTMQKVSRITWNFFEFQRQQEQREVPPPPELVPPPGYVPINNVVPGGQ